MKFCDTCHATYPTDFTTCPRDQTTLRLATDLMQGMIIRDKYEIVGKIGSGGMATVYRARHLVFNEPRAIKLVSSRMLEDENFLKRFRNEAVITRKLQHPNAVRVDDVDTTDDGRPCMIMELVEGRNLRAAIEQEGALPVARALEIARQVALALGAAHRLGITHRDIKPDNIVLVALPDGKDQVKVLDFGIAKLRESGSGGAYTATQTGMVIGTPQYISPEQAAGKRGDEVDGRADLYSLGVVLYEMLTGRLPFQSDTPMALLLQHMQNAPPLPRQVRPDLNIPEPVSRLLMKALEKDPGKRFQSAEEMISALQQPEQWDSQDAGSETCVIGSDEYPAPRGTTEMPAPPAPAAAKTVAAKTVAAKTLAAKTVAARIAQPVAQESHTGRWVAIAAVVLLLLAGGYFVASRRAPQASPSAGASATSVEAARPVTEPSTPAAEAPPVTAAQPQADPPKPPQDKRVRELVASGRRHVDNGEYDLAIRDLRAALGLEPGDAAAQAQLRRAEQAKRTEEQVLGRKH